MSPSAIRASHLPGDTNANDKNKSAILGGSSYIVLEEVMGADANRGSFSLGCAVL